MTLYFHRLRAINFFYVLIYICWKENKLPPKTNIYYVDISRSGYFLSWITKKFLKNRFLIENLSFSLTDIKEESGELTRIQIVREELFKFNEKVISSNIYQGIKRKSQLSSTQEYYIQKEILDGTILEKDSVSRILYVLAVVSKHSNNLNLYSCFLVLDKYPWESIISDLASKKNIQVLSVSKFNFSDGLVKFARSFPKLYNILKAIKSKKNQPLKLEKPPLENYLFLDGRGDISLENDIYNSDFFWQVDSHFPKQNIAYLCKSKAERSYISDYGSYAVDGLPYLRDLIFSKNKLNLSKEHRSQETKKFTEIKNKYNTQYLYWHTLFRKNNIKIYLSWFKYDASHIVIKDAINSLGGLSVIWQIAFDGIQNFECKTYSDIVMSYSPFSLELEKRLDSKIRYNILTGYPKKYLNQILKPAAIDIRKNLISAGADYIVSVFDENSGDDKRWHTGHELQKENYIHIIEELLRNEKLGIIFKPKNPLTLKHRLGDASSLLDRAVATGRCKVFLDSGRYTSKIPPLLAALSSDLCIHGHLSAGTAGLESALAGVPTILIDREQSVHSKLRQLPHGIVRFNDWNEAIYAMNIYFQDNQINKEFGNWDSVLDDLDSFRDGLGSQRMGNYLNNLLEGMNSGMNKDQAMERAAEIYSNEWGVDKIRENRDIL